MKNDNKFLWDQFCKLGEMIGDGMHHEDPWISKEYKRLMKILVPPSKEEKEFHRKVRKIKNENINKQVQERIKTDRCTCGGELNQTRSGSKTVVCTDSTCGNKFRYNYVKK